LSRYGESPRSGDDLLPASRQPPPVDRLVKENDVTPGNGRRDEEEFMMRNNVQRLGEHVTAALLGRLTILRWQDRGQFPYGLRLPVERHADAAS
jgi:hypothetical protein